MSTPSALDDAGPSRHAWPSLHAVGLHPAEPEFGRLVLDTHVWLEALVWSSRRHSELLPLLQRGKALALRSGQVEDEWQRVLRYPNLGLTPAVVAAAEQAFCDCTQEAHPDLGALSFLPRCADPDDQKFLQLAWHGGAHALLTRDRRLLKIGKHRLYRTRFVVTTPERWRSEGAGLWQHVQARSSALPDGAIGHLMPKGF